MAVPSNVPRDGTPHHIANPESTPPPVNGVEPDAQHSNGHVPQPQYPASILERVNRFLNQLPTTDDIRRTQDQTRTSLKVIHDALDRYDIQSLALSYNGGKDCLVLLCLFLAALASHPTVKDAHSRPNLKTVYIVSRHPFAEIESFVQQSSETYGLQLVRYEKPMKAAFEDYLADHPEVKAIFVGTRRTDPHGGNLTHFDPTDHGWPSFMRVHPVIDWHYVEIWTFIRQLEIPYCVLYDWGFTSLGGVTDTYRNPSLRRTSMSESGKPKIEYRPAYELVEDEEERLGRDREMWKGIALANESAVIVDGED